MAFWHSWGPCPTKGIQRSDGKPSPWQILCLRLFRPSSWAVRSLTALHKFHISLWLFSFVSTFLLHAHNHLHFPQNCIFHQVSSKAVLILYILIYYARLSHRPVTRNGSENKLSLLPSDMSRPKRKRGVSKEKLAISEKLENLKQCTALLVASHLNL